MRRSFTMRLLGRLLAGSLVFVGCGGDDEVTVPAPTGTLAPAGKNEELLCEWGAQAPMATLPLTKGILR